MEEDNGLQRRYTYSHFLYQACEIRILQHVTRLHIIVNPSITVTGMRTNVCSLNINLFMDLWIKAGRIGMSTKFAQCDTCYLVLFCAPLYMPCCLDFSIQYFTLRVTNSPQAILHAQVIIQFVEFCLFSTLLFQIKQNILSILKTLHENWFPWGTVRGMEKLFRDSWYLKTSKKNCQTKPELSLDAEMAQRRLSSFGLCIKRQGYDNNPRKG